MTAVKGKTELTEHLFSAHTHVISHARPPHYINMGSAMHLVVTLNDTPWSCVAPHPLTILRQEVKKNESTLKPNFA